MLFYIFTISFPRLRESFKEGKIFAVEEGFFASKADARSMFPWAGSASETSARSAEATLVVAAQTGDTEAFDSLMRNYRERVWAVVNNLSANREDASDITQEVFIKAFRNIHKYNFRSSFYTWVYRIAVNEALNALRKNRLKKALMLDRLDTQQDDDSYLSASATARTRNPFGVLENELQAQLDRALRQLTDEHRTVVVLAEIENLPLKEVAEILKVGEGTVKSRLHYAKKQLQSLLKPYLKL